MALKIEVREAHIGYPQKTGFFQSGKKWHPVVQGVSFDLNPGDCTGLVGESGSGKSTIGLCLAGLLPYQSGSILYQKPGFEPQKWHSDLRQSLQIIFQDATSALNPRRSILEQLKDPLRRWFPQDKKNHLERCAAILQEVGLSAAMLERFPHEFSGGQRQRIGIARALLCQPEVLICDEVTSALDVHTQEEILALLRDLQIKRGLSLLMITHDLAVVHQMCQHVLVLHQGKCVEQGPTQKVFQNPQEPYTRELLSAVPQIPRFF
jgi:peptide/nickel transport system ATP-binding protein